MKKSDVILPAERVKQVEKVEKEIAAKFRGLAPIDQVLGVHNHLVDTIRYGVLTEGNKQHHAQGKYGALVDKVAICEDYALGFSAIMKRLGIKSRTVRGYIADQKHAWNMVELDGEWYHVDATADDIEFNLSNGTVSPIMKYRYFLLDEDTLKNTHRDFTYHDGTGTKYRDYPLKEIKIDSLNELNPVLEKQFERFTDKQGYIDIFSKNTLSRDVLKKAVEDYFKDKNISVSIDPNGFTNFSFRHIIPEYILQSIKITINEAINNQSVSFLDLSFDNEAENKLSLTLSNDIEGLSLNHLVVSGATKQTLEKVNGEVGKYLLTVDSYVKGTDLKVEIKKRGYNLQPSSKIISLPAENTGEPEPTPPPSEKPNDGKTKEKETPAPDGNKPPSNGDGASSGGGAPSGGGASSGGGAKAEPQKSDEKTSLSSSQTPDYENKSELILSVIDTKKAIKDLLKNKNHPSSKKDIKKLDWELKEKEASNLVSIAFEKEDLKHLENSNTNGLNIKAENFELFLPQSYLKNSRKHSDGSVELKIKKEEEDGNPSYHFSLLSSEGKELRNLGKHKMIISLPYRLKEGETPESLIAYTFDKNGNKKVISNSYYDKEANTLRIATSSLSTFTLDVKQNTEEFFNNHKNRKDIDFIRNRNIIKFNTTTMKPDSSLTFGELLSALTKLEQKNINKKSYLKWAKANQLIRKGEKQSLKKAVDFKTFTKIVNQYAKMNGFTGKLKSQSTKKLSRSKAATLLRRYIESMNQ